VVLRKKPQSTFCVSVRLWLHSDIHFWAPSFRPWRYQEIKYRGHLEQGSSNLAQNMGHKWPVLRPRCIGPGKAGTQIPFNSLKNKNQLYVTYYFICFSLQPGHYSSLTAPNLQPTANQERNDQCGNQHYSRELLMMGIVVSETCWAYKKYNKITSGI